MSWRTWWSDLIDIHNMFGHELKVAETLVSTVRQTFLKDT